MTHTRNLLLMSVAAGALIVGVNAVLAQAPAPQAPAAQAPAAQHSAPAEKVAPAMEPSKGAAPDAGMKSGQADDKKGVKAAQDNNMKPKPTASETKAPDASRTGKTSSEMKAGDKAKADVKVDTKSSEKMGDSKSSDTNRPTASLRRSPAMPRLRPKPRPTPSPPPRARARQPALPSCRPNSAQRSALPSRSRTRVR